MKPPLKPYTLYAKIGIYKTYLNFETRNTQNESTLKHEFRKQYPFLSHLKCRIYEEGEEDKILKEYEKYKINSMRALKISEPPSEATGHESTY